MVLWCSLTPNANFRFLVKPALHSSEKLKDFLKSWVHVESVSEHASLLNTTPGCVLPFNFRNNIVFGDCKGTVSYLFFCLLLQGLDLTQFVLSLGKSKWLKKKYPNRSRQKIIVFLLLNIWSNIQLLQIGASLVKITGSLQWRWDATGLNLHLWKLPSVCDSSVRMICASSGPE